VNDLNRFFTGHTKNLDGRVQFREGNTSAADAINGATKILAVSVCSLLIIHSI
jgi:Ca2+-transporting ATPase